MPRRHKKSSSNKPKSQRGGSPKVSGGRSHARSTVNVTVNSRHASGGKGSSPSAEAFRPKKKKGKRQRQKRTAIPPMTYGA